MSRHIDFNPKLNLSPAATIKNKGAWWKLNRKKSIALILILLISLSTGWFLVKAAIMARRIITDNTTGSAPSLLSSILGDVDARQLKGEGDGRINILLLGLGGEGHTAPNLTDTIIVASIDPRKKTIAMLSIPRDLYINIGDNYGYGKINSVYAYGEQDNYSGGGGAFIKERISELLDLPIHYYARIDFEGFRKMVDTVGGITVDVEKDIYDYAYPNYNNGYDPFFITKGMHEMDGEVALRYARSRHTTSDFDRARRQQQVMSALKGKALNINFISNPAKISKTLDILGDHLRTDIQLWEMERMYDLMKDVNTDTIVNKVLDNSVEGLLVDGRSDGGGYILLPRAGDFSEIRNFVHSIFIDSYIKEENARISLWNGTPRTGLATRVSSMLEPFGYNIIEVKNAPEKTHQQSVIYDYTGGTKPYTIQYLKNRFDAKVENFSRLPGDGAEIVVIIGDVYQEDYSANKYSSSLYNSGN